MNAPKPLPIDRAWTTDVLLALLRTPSPSGRTDAVMQLVGNTLKEIGCEFSLTRRGALLAELPGPAEGADRAVVVHADTIGAMVEEAKPNGRLAVGPIGTWSARFAEGGTVTIFTDDLDVTYTGTVLPLKASGHAYDGEVNSQGVGWNHVEVRVDEPVVDAAGLAALGIQVGDFVASDAEPTPPPSGLVKSRHLDGKAGVAAALGAYKALIDHQVALPTTAHLLVTIAQEVGHGASHGLDADVAEMVWVDNAVVAPGQHSIGQGVTIPVRDETGPFDYHLTRKLLGLCAEADLEHTRDVFRHYRSDVPAALEAGAGTRAALVAFGLDASHGHERTHLDSIEGVAQLLTAYLQTELTFAGWDAAPTGPLEDFPSSKQPAAEQER